MTRFRTARPRRKRCHDEHTRPEQLPNERRVQLDRRLTPTTFRSTLRRGGRRKGSRRAHEPWSGYVDCLSPWVVALVIWVVIGSALDALFSLLHFSQGFSEANPIMALTLAADTEVFVIIKMAVSAGGAWILAAHQQHLLALRGLYGLALVYLGVLAIHGLLIFTHS